MPNYCRLQPLSHAPRFSGSTWLLPAPRISRVLRQRHINTISRSRHTATRAQSLRTLLHRPTIKLCGSVFRSTHTSCSWSAAEVTWLSGVGRKEAAGRVETAAAKKTSTSREKRWREPGREMLGSSSGAENTQWVFTWTAKRVCVAFTDSVCNEEV